MWIMLYVNVDDRRGRFIAMYPSLWETNQNKKPKLSQATQNHFTQPIKQKHCPIECKATQSGIHWFIFPMIHFHLVMKWFHSPLPARLKKHTLSWLYLPGLCPATITSLVCNRCRFGVVLQKERFNVKRKITPPWGVTPVLTCTHPWVMLKEGKRLNCHFRAV